jgi:hypothetical protein
MEGVLVFLVCVVVMAVAIGMVWLIHRLIIVDNLTAWRIALAVLIFLSFCTLSGWLFF